MEQTYHTMYTEVGLQIHNFKFALRLPKMRKPKLFRRSKHKSESSDDEFASLKAELLRKYNRVGAKKVSSTSTNSINASSEDSEGDDWMRDFHRRYNPLVLKVRTLDEDQTLDESVLSGGPPDLTSTPVNLRIRPLNRDINAAGPLEYSPELNPSAAVLDSTDMSGVKIYENIDGGDRSLALEDLNASYEIVTIDKRVLARAHFRPRSLAFN